MSTPRVVAVVGFKDAGKTRVVEALVSEFSLRGYKVGTLKHASPEHHLDTPGKDTMRHREAGSLASSILTTKHSAIFLNYPLNVEESISKMGRLDLVILEGFKSLDSVPRIMVPRNEEEIYELSNGLEIAISGPLLDKIPDSDEVPFISLTRVSELADLVESKSFPLLPGSNCGSCGYDSCRALAKAIVSGEDKAESCVNMYNRALRLRVNHKEFKLNPFVQKIIRNTVLGMISSLKGGEKTRKVELAFEVRDE